MSRWRRLLDALCAMFEAHARDVASRVEALSWEEYEAGYQAGYLDGLTRAPNRPHPAEENDRG